MKTHRKHSSNHESRRRDEVLSAADVADHLHVLARTHQSDALRRLSEDFSRHGSRPISELAITDKGSDLPFVWQPGVHSVTGENGKPTSRKRRSPNGGGRSLASPSRRITSTLPDDLESLSREEVERILEDDRLTKRQIAELGHTRFGISHSSLLRARKDRAINSILSALRNERTMQVIAEQAHKAGRMRTA